MAKHTGKSLNFLIESYLYAMVLEYKLHWPQAFEKKK